MRQLGKKGGVAVTDFLHLDVETRSAVNLKTRRTLGLRSAPEHRPLVRLLGDRRWRRPDVASRRSAAAGAGRARGRRPPAGRAQRHGVRARDLASPPGTSLRLAGARRSSSGTAPARSPPPWRCHEAWTKRPGRSACRCGRTSAGHRLMLQMARPRRVEPDGSDRLVGRAGQGRAADRLLPAGRRGRARAPSAPASAVRPRARGLPARRPDQRARRRGRPRAGRGCRGAGRRKPRRSSTPRSDSSPAARSKRRPRPHASLTWLQVRGVDADERRQAGGRRAARGRPPGRCPPRPGDPRRGGARSSTAKLRAFRARTCGDGRLRDNLLYHGAATGRWSGRGVQLQNLPRPSVVNDVEAAIATIRGREPAWWVDAFYRPAAWPWSATACAACWSRPPAWS